MESELLKYLSNAITDALHIALKEKGIAHAVMQVKVTLPDGDHFTSFGSVSGTQSLGGGGGSGKPSGKKLR